MLQVLRELIDAVADLRGISANQQAALHAALDREADGLSAAPAAKAAKAEPAPPASLT